MGPRRLIPLLALAACRTVPNPPLAQPAPSSPVVEPAAPPKPVRPTLMADRVVYDFEQATLASRDAYVGLFDFAAVGEMEILLHRYDLLGRLENLPEDIKGQFAAEGAVPYPAERERRNVGGFYKVLAQRTVGSGGCKLRSPRTEYAQQLATFEPLPEGTAVDYEPLRQKALGYVAKGGLVAFACKGGRGGIALVWTARDNERGYDLITIYDD